MDRAGAGLKVLFFSRGYTTHDRHFLEKLGRAHETWFLPLEKGKSAFEKRGLPRGVRLAPGRDIAAAIAKLKPDLVHAGPIPTCGWLAAKTGFRPLLVMSWGSDILDEAARRPVQRRRAVAALRRSDMLVCDCDAVREKIQRWLPYPNERVVQFPWGADLKTFRPGPARLGLRKLRGWKDATILLSTRTWEPLLGPMTILEGFAAAHLSNPSLRLVMLGDGPLGPRVRRFIAARGLKDAVLLPGRVAHDRLRDYFRSADVYLAGSHSDGSSVSLLEAMACALPVIVTDIPGNREWIPSAKHGLLYPPGDARALASRIGRLASDPKGRAAMGRSNLAKARRDADWDKNFKRLIKAYDKFVPAGRRGKDLL